MTVNEIFGRINAHQIEGIMLHDQLAEYFDFLNLQGYKRQQEYHALAEFAERRTVVRYFLNHFNRLLPETSAKDPEAIPAAWRSYTRQQVDAGTKRKAVRDAFLRWRSWESETKKLYEQAYSDLCDLGEIAAACKVKQLVECVDAELKCVDRQHITLESVDYDLSLICLCQDELHAEYADKSEHIGVKIC